MTERMRRLYEERARLVENQRALLDRADTESRGMSSEETEQYERMDADFERLTSEIDREERLAEREQTNRVQTPGREDQTQDGPAPEMRGLEAYIRRGAITPELRALQADSDIYGGYLTTPVQFVNELIQAIDDSVFIREWARVLRVTSAESLGAPSLDNDPADPAWTAEIGSASEDSTMSFGNRELTPHKLSKLIKVSNKLLRMTSGSAESLVRARLAYKFSVVEENSFLNGTGAGQPLGLFTASANGIATTYDVSTGNTTTSITTDGLIEALFGLKEGYQRNARWIFHRDAVKQIRKLKDGDGQYIWQAGIGGTPSTVMDKPYRMSEYAPNTFTTGLYVGIVGDFSNYWIADAESVELQRLVELYAATDQTGFVGRMWVDGMPVLGEAFRRVKLA